MAEEVTARVSRYILDGSDDVHKEPPGVLAKSCENFLYGFKAGKGRGHIAIGDHPSPPSRTRGSPSS